MFLRVGAVLALLVLAAVAQPESDDGMKMKDLPTVDDALKWGGKETGSSEEWYKKMPTPKRVFYVAPENEKTKRDGSEASPFRLADVLSGGNMLAPGDLFVLFGGTYFERGSGSFKFEKVNGTESNPIVVRAKPGERVTIKGKLDIRADHWWFWGLEITDPDNIAPKFSAVRTLGNGIRVINCLIHEIEHGNGIYSPAGYSGQVFYGNMLYQTGENQKGMLNFDKLAPPNLIFHENNFHKTGYKYTVHNVLLDQSKLCGEKCHNFYGFADPEMMEWDDERASGYWLEGNIVHEGYTLVGGRGPPSDKLMLKDNILSHSRFQIGFRQPTQAIVKDNYLAWTWLDTQYLWGTGEAHYNDVGKNEYTGNTVLNEYDFDNHESHEGYVLKLRTASYTDKTTDVEGSPNFRSGDVFDNNEYGPKTARFQVNAAGLMQDNMNFTEYQTFCESAGAPFDKNSQLIDLPTETETKGFRNVYDDQRGYIAVFNWKEENITDVDLSVLGLQNGDRFNIFDPRDFYREVPIVEGKYQGNSIKLAVNESQSENIRFSTWVVEINAYRFFNTRPTPNPTPAPTVFQAGQQGSMAANPPSATPFAHVVTLLLLFAALFAVPSWNHA